MELAHAGKQGVSQIGVNTRVMVLVRDTKALEIDNPCIVRRPRTSDRGKRTAGGNSACPCRRPQPGQQNSTGDHRTKPPVRNVSRSKMDRKTRRKLYHRSTGCQCKFGTLALPIENPITNRGPEPLRSSSSP